MTDLALRSAAPFVVLYALLSPPALATNSKAELQQVMQDLLAWLPGDYSSQGQLDMERRLGAPPDGPHEHRYHVLAPIHAPQISQHVIYGQLHAGGPDGAIIPGTQIAYIVELDEDNMTVNVNGRRIANGEDFENVHLDPARQREIKLDPATGGNCDFRWRRHGRQITGHLRNKQDTEAETDGTCTMVSKVSGLKMTWDAEWILNEEELWIYDNGYLEDGQLFIGREDKTHERRFRVHEYQCNITSDGVTSSLRVGDGGATTATAAMGKMTLLRSFWPAPGGGLEARLALRLLSSDGGIAAEQLAPAAAGRVTLQVADGRIDCLKAT
jgi:hypothetical protein